MSEQAEAAIRALRFEDRASVNELRGRHGWSELSPDNWTRLYFENQAILRSGRPLGVGWVAAASGRIVGFLGSVPLLYRRGGRTLIAAAASNFVVDAEFRGLSLALAARFFQQKGVDFLINTTADTAVGGIFGLFKARRVPQKGCDRVLFRVLHGTRFAEASLRKLGVPGFLCVAVSPVAGSALRVFQGARMPFAPAVAPNLKVEASRSPDFDSEFDVLWEKRLGGGDELMADRSSAVLRWHFGDPERSIQVIRCRRDSRLAGFAVIGIEDSREWRLRRAQLLDILADDDAPGVLDALLAACETQARKNGCAVFEVCGAPRAVRMRFERRKPLRRRLPSWPVFYRASDPDLVRELESEGAWYLTRYDGDSSL